jgi:hypothetical protein
MIKGKEFVLFSTAKINIAKDAWLDTGYVMLNTDEAAEFVKKADVKAELAKIEKNGRLPYMLMSLKKNTPTGQKTASIEPAKSAKSIQSSN